MGRKRYAKKGEAMLDIGKQGHGGGGYLVTRVERKTLYATKWIKSSTLAGIPARRRKSITFDNGKEFCDAQAIEKTTGAKATMPTPTIRGNVELMSTSTVCFEEITPRGNHLGQLQKESPL